ncbi:hypothetical protein CHS0354_030054 [Potamilus streckersoni]|uniref:UDP N-acetylglucosamine O-acyltransferase C-terminal domain-containing protein n=1 Tax=Potamilus streckersoni TaxID=2493646 RepID=A0AAE0RLF0_9BIVA|nr:hypothetical protein CHS0354_030054 [Potamilus streckersoni]
MAIANTAVIHPDARLGKNVSVGEYCVIEADAEIGDDCFLDTHVVVKSKVRMGTGNRISSFTTLGGLPQHTRHNPDESHPLIIGNHNVFREHISVHLGTVEPTVIGDNNYIMIQTHIGHDCQIGNQCTIGGTVIAGHVRVGNNAVLALNAIHQFCRIGDYAMLAGGAAIRKDVPPFVLVGSNPVAVYKLNSVALRRAGISRERINALSDCYRLFKTILYRDTSLDILSQHNIPATEDVIYLINWLQQPSSAVSTVR